MLAEILVAFAAPFLATPITVPIEVRGTYIIVDDVRVSGLGPYRFLLDTGAQSTVLDPDLFRALALRPEFRVKVATISGEFVAPGVSQCAVSVAGHAMRSVEILTYPIPAAKRIGRRIDGILGQSFLSQFDYQIDYKRRVLIIDPAGKIAPQVSGARHSLIVVENRPALAYNDTRLVLDSAASHVVVPHRDAVASGSIGAFYATAVASTGSQGRLQWTTLRWLSLGTMRLSNVQAAILPPGSQTEGLLPLHLFESVLISNRYGYVVLGPPR